MAQRTVIAATTDAVTDGNQLPFVLRGVDFKHGFPVVTVEGLAGVETISFWKKGGADWLPVASSDGTQVSFDVAYPSDVFNGPGEYGITKTATAGAITLYVDSWV